jgi:hypothetical protein
MSELVYEDNLVYPQEKEVIKFEGKDPFRIYYNIKDILKKVFELGGKDIIEKEIKWDNTSVDKFFLVKWECKRSIDAWTKIIVNISVKGTQNSNTKEGKIVMSMKPVFRTEISSGFFQSIFWWIYYYIYYKNKRLQDFYRAKTLINKLRKQIGELYEMEIGISE